jgi:hypothetical protein
MRTGAHRSMMRSPSATGWGVIFGSDVADETHEALQPLLNHRKAQAERYYCELSLRSPHETAYQFFSRLGIAPGRSRTALPYHLLLVGSPQEISFPFQYLIGVQHSVGRLCFDSAESYAKYSDKVIKSESRKLPARGGLAAFVPRHPEDPVTRQHLHIASRLVQIVADRIPDLRVQIIDTENATKEQLMGLLSQNERLAVIFVLAHGAWYPPHHELQVSNQGGILCQEFYIRNSHGRADDMTSAVMFCADSVGDNVDITAEVIFLDACHSVGTTQFDDLPLEEPERFAPADMISALPSRLLAAAGTGPLAIIGHVNRPCDLVFFWKRAWATVYDETLRRLLRGFPVGHAIRAHKHRLLSILAMTHPINTDRGGRNGAVSESHLDTLATNERNLIVLGDPAVHVSSPYRTWRR